jgi:hypothetical protein
MKSILKHLLSHQVHYHHHPYHFVHKLAPLKRNVKGKSDVWLHFQIYNEKKFNAHAFCLLCKSDVKYGQMHSTTNLKNIYKEIMKKNMKE